MGTYADLSGCLGTYGPQWGPMGSFRELRVQEPMGIHGVYADLWGPMGIFEHLWGLWRPMGSYGELWGPYGFMLGPMGTFWDPWLPIGTSGTFGAPWGGLGGYADLQLPLHTFRSLEGPHSFVYGSREPNLSCMSPLRFGWL